MVDGGGPDDAALEVSRLLAGTYERYRARRRRVMAGRNVTPAMTMLLKRLAAADRAGVTVSEMAREACVASSTVSVTLKRLERRGLVLRRRDARDERRVLVVLTREGRRLAEDSPEESETSPLTQALARLSTEERRQLVFWLRFLQAALDKSGGDCPR